MSATQTGCQKKGEIDFSLYGKFEESSQNISIKEGGEPRSSTELQDIRERHPKQWIQMRGGQRALSLWEAGNTTCKSHQKARARRVLSFALSRKWSVFFQGSFPENISIFLPRRLVREKERTQCMKPEAYLFYIE